MRRCVAHPAACGFAIVAQPQAARCIVSLLLVVLLAPSPAFSAAAPAAPAPAPAAAPAEKSPPAKDDKDDIELYRLLADTVDQIDRNYVKEVDRRELIEAAIRGMMTKLDPYSVYIGPEEVERFRSSVEAEFGGLGIQVSIDDGELVVISPMHGTPAYRGGILAGDRIVEIDGKSTDGITIDEAVTRLKGKEGSKATLTVIHPGKTSRQKITLTRERIHVETVLGDRRNAKDDWDFMLDPRERIGYIRVTAFSRETAGELRKALEQLRAARMRALILDLRFNPGGLLNSAIEVSGLFVSQGRIVSTKGRNTPERIWDAHKEGTFEGFPMVVLVNRYSASASEIVSACLQDHKRAVIMGERTWGKGSVQNIIELEGGRSALKLTTAAYLRPSGKNIHRFPNAKEKDDWGVRPDKSYELKLSESELTDLLEDRRDRDVLHSNQVPQPQPEKPTAVLPVPGEHKPETAKAGDTAKPKPTAKPDAAKPSTTTALAAGKTPFTDRQLEMAVKYLSSELARAK